jgi:hypothetical protein
VLGTALDFVERTGVLDWLRLLVHVGLPRIIRPLAWMIAFLCRSRNGRGQGPVSTRTMSVQGCCALRKLGEQYNL